MFEKYKDIQKIFILFIFVISLLYGIGLIIYNVFNKEEIISPISYEQIDVHINEENLITTDYVAFYTLQTIIQDVITALHEDKTTEVYNILTEDLKKHIGKDKNKLQEYYIKNFEYRLEEDMFIAGYSNSENLIYVYKVDNYNYLCVVDSLVENGTTKIGINLLGKNRYLISYIEI